MKYIIKSISVLDHNDVLHKVDFHKGVNVITGKSSTGKSALLEIFDYCLGSSDKTIPVGVITDNAFSFNLILKFETYFLVIIRKHNCNNLFIKKENLSFDDNCINIKYLEKKYVVKDRFKNRELSKWLGLKDMEIDDDENYKKITGQKKGRPSIRNMIPYLLQHQNLIANKHSLFYRFDDKVKKEQTIDQFKIFSGFVDEEYFYLKYKLSTLYNDIRRLTKQKETFEKEFEYNKTELITAFNIYEKVSGFKLFEDDINKILNNINFYIEELNKIEINVDYSNDELPVYFKELEKDRDFEFIKRRKHILKKQEIMNTISAYESYGNQIKKDIRIEDSKIKLSTCPFCKKENNNNINESNELVNAISWLNSELQLTPDYVTSFVQKRKEIEMAIKNSNQIINKFDSEIYELKKIIQLNNNVNSKQKEAQVFLYKIESILISISNNQISNINNEILNMQKQINKNEKIIKDKYNITSKMKEANIKINSYMNEIAENFDFEDSYKPINLKFDLDTFELWLDKNYQKIYLRSMGSGANWLYTHISLFLALNKYFISCEYAIVPPILFLDQPSQVYFPTSIKDDKIKFEPNYFKKITDGEENIQKIDDDINAVTNLFDTLVNFVIDVENEFNNSPQIIVLEHADNLNLNSSLDFNNDLVKDRRWREKAFIKL